MDHKWFLFVPVGALLAVFRFLARAAASMGTGDVGFLLGLRLLFL